MSLILLQKTKQMQLLLLSLNTNITQAYLQYRAIVKKETSRFSEVNIKCPFHATGFQRVSKETSGMKWLKDIKKNKLK